MKQKIDNTNDEIIDKTLPISDDRKRSQIQFKIGRLLYQLNSRFGAYGHIEPSLENQKLMYNKIIELRSKC